MNLSYNAENSLIKWAIEFDRDLEYVELDARAELRDADLPNKDIIGLTQYSIMDMNKVYEVHFMVGISTYNDENLFRLKELSARLFEELKTGKQIPYYDTETQEVASYMAVIEGTTLLPTHRVESRPFRFLQAVVLLDPAE